MNNDRVKPHSEVRETEANFLRHGRHCGSNGNSRRRTKLSSCQLLQVRFELSHGSHCVVESGLLAFLWWLDANWRDGWGLHLIYEVRFKVIAYKLSSKQSITHP